MYSVDVIIPSYRPDHKLRELLEKLLRQSYPVQKIILINTEKSLLDPGLLPDDARIFVTHITKAEFDHAGARNLGVSKSGADLFLMMTEDAVPKDETLVGRLVQVFERDAQKAGEGAVGAVYGRQLATEESSYDEQYARRFNYPAKSFVKTEKDLPRLGIKTYFESNVCCMYRRDIFDRLGGFRAPAIFNEDMVYCGQMLQAGYASAYEASAEVYHAHHYSGRQQFHRNFDLGVSQAEHPEIFDGLRAEGEGVRMVLGNAQQLLRKGRLLQLPDLVWKSACKYIGFRMGKNFRKLPHGLVMRCTMSPDYWRMRSLQ